MIHSNRTENRLISQIMASKSTLYVLGAAVVGIVSAAGLFLMEHIRQERRRQSMAQNLARLDQEVCYLQKELEMLRTSSTHSQSTVQKRKKRCAIRNTSSSSNISSRSYDSVHDGDSSSDLEFYDLSDDESVSSTVTVTPLEQTLQALDRNLNELEAETVRQAYDTLNELNAKHPSNVEILTHLGKACYKMISTVNDQAVKRELTRKGIEMCAAALDINPCRADAHKWYAILVGIRSNSQPIQGKISDGYLFKQHIDAAIAITPDDPTLRHMLGRFTFESANLKWYERKVASTFFSDPPNGTFDEALDQFLAAESLMTMDWKENKLMIGKCLLALGRYKEAVEALKIANSMTNNSLDNEVDSEVKVLLKKYNTYR